MKRISVVSDLHIFCGRSVWKNKLRAIEDAIRSSDIFVLNGDTFDFRWSNSHSLDFAFEKAIDFLRHLTSINPECHIHLNLGNHDHHSEFCKRLAELEKELPNFSWHPYYLRIGTLVFLHGEPTERKMSHKQLEKYRKKWERKRPITQPMLDNLYDLAVKSKAHVILTRMFFTKRRIARNLLWYLKSLGLDSNSGITDVYFGHTHVPVANFRYKGISFHNSGTAYKGMKLNILRTLIL